MRVHTTKEQDLGPSRRPLGPTRGGVTRASSRHHRLGRRRTPRPSSMADSVAKGQAYFDKHKLSAQLSKLVNDLAEAQPDDPIKFIVQQLATTSLPDSAGMQCLPTAGPAPPTHPEAADKVCPCNIFGDIMSFDKPVVSKPEKIEYPPWYPTQGPGFTGLMVRCPPPTAPPPPPPAPAACLSPAAI